MTVPKLRFKEFDGDWSFSKIGEIFKVTSGATPLRSDNRFFENANIPWVKTTDLNNSFISNTEEKISEIALKETSVKILPKGTVFVAMYGGFNQIGRTGLLLNESACNQALSAIYPNEKVDAFFLLTYLNHKVDDWKNFAASSRKDPNITKSDVLAFPLVYPSKEEQTKIAAFLSAVDEKISQLIQKYELLSQYKQGMMQKLFSQQLRFKADDGSEFGEWEENTIQYFLDQNYIIDQMDGNHGELYPKSEEFSDLGIPYIGATDFSNGTVCFATCKRLPLERALKFKKGIAKDGDVLFAHNATVGPVAILKTSFEFVILSTTATYYRCNSNKLINTYLKNILASDYFKKQYTGIMSQSTRNQVPITTQRKLKLVLPCLEEQTKIANFLSAVDQKIEVVVQQIEQAKTWKKGLLQQMFV